MKTTPPSAASLAEKFEERAENLIALVSGYLEETSEESVHDVRTTIRRLMTFHRTLPKSIRNEKSAREYVQLCRRFFRANTSVRDKDVIRARLQEDCGFREDDPLVVALAKRRNSRLAHARRLGSELEATKPPSLLADQISNRKLKRRYRKLIDDLIDRLETEIPLVLSDGKRVKELHRVRKQFKKLRYLLELSAGQKSVSKALKEFTELQDLLGAIRDDDITIAYLSRSARSERSVEAKNLLATRREANYKKLVEAYGPKLLSRQWLLTSL